MGIEAVDGGVAAGHRVETAPQENEGRSLEKEAIANPGDPITF